LKGILGILRCLFFGTITYSSSKPQIGLCLKAEALLIWGFIFSDRTDYYENGELLTKDADEELAPCEKMSAEDLVWDKEKLEAFEKSPLNDMLSLLIRPLLNFEIYCWGLLNFSTVNFELNGDVSWDNPPPDPFMNEFLLYSVSLVIGDSGIWALYYWVYKLPWLYSSSLSCISWIRKGLSIPRTWF